MTRWLAFVTDREQAPKAGDELQCPIAGLDWFTFGTVSTTELQEDGMVRVIVKTERDVEALS